MLALLNILRYGLFCLLMGALLTDFALLCFAGSVVALFATALNGLVAAAGLGVLALLMSSGFGALGMLMSFAVPDKSSRVKVGLSVFFQFLGFCFSLFPVIPFAANICFVLGWLMFTAFLGALAESIESQRADDLIWLIRVVAGFNSSIVFAIFFIWPLIGALIFVTIWIADASLYAFLLYILQADLGAYIEGVKSGRIDPAAKSKRATMFTRALGPMKGPPPEEPTGPPPEGANVYKVPKNLPPLHAAVKEGERNKVLGIIKEGADVNESIKNGLAPLHIAAVYGVMDVADCLLKAGARLEQEADRGLTPLMIAVQTGNPNMTGYLISKGANLNHQNEDGLTPLHWACCAPHERMTGLARIKMVTLLREKGAQFEVKDSQGRTPLDLAELNNLKLLVASINRAFGIVPIEDVQEPDNSDINVTSVEDAEPVGFQLQGAELCAIPAGDLPPLHDVVKLGDADKVEAALAARADVHQPVGHGMTPLHIAAIVGVMASADLLLRKGARTEDTCEGGFTPLFWAIQTNNTNLVGLLLSRGANVNHKNDQGRTPLHWAAAVPSKKLEGQTRVRMVQMLLQKKADPKAVDSSNKTPGWLAQEAGYPEVAQAIERHMAPVQKVQDDDDE